MIKSIQRIQWLKGNQPAVPFGSFSKVEAAFNGHSPLAGPYVQTKQVHGSKIVAANICTNSATKPEADGLYTSIAKTKIAVKTADCLPLLFCHINQNFVMALHIGWKGLCKRIIGKSFKILEEHDIHPRDMYAAFGPCISPQSFEVGEEVVEVFLDSYLDFSSTQQNLCLTKGVGKKWFLDMSMAGCIELLDQDYDAAKIHVFRNCTVTEKKSWHSYRRGAIAHERNYSWIMIK